MKNTILILGLFSMSLISYAQTFTPIQLQIERPDDSEKIDFFGYGLDVYEDIAIVGADGKQEETGAVYFYERNKQTNQWEMDQEIWAFDNLPSNNFGKSVSISNNFAFVGSNSGAYIYKLNETSDEWELHNKLIPQHTSENLTKVQVNENFAVLNIPDYSNGNLSGYMYIYKYNENSDAWMPLDTITPEITANYSLFAEGFELTDQNIVISSWYAVTSNYSTYISIYNFDGEHFQQELIFEDDDLNMNIRVGYVTAVGDSLISFKGYDLDEQVVSFFTMKKDNDTWQLSDTLLPAGPIFRDLKNIVMDENYLIAHYDQGSLYENVYSDIYYFNNGHYEYMNSIIYAEGNEDHYGFGYAGYAFTGAKILIGEPWGFSVDGLTRGSFYYYGPNFPAIISSPNDQLEVQEGTDVTFSCNALYVTDYQWQFSVDNGETFENTPEEPPFNNTQTQTLTVNAQVYLNNAQFRCMLGNEFYMEVYTDTALLTINGVSVYEIEDKGIIVYPNPVLNSLRIDVTSYPVDYNYEIVNISGIRIREGYFSKNTSIDLTSLPAGIYTIRIKSDTYTKTYKFIKQ